MRLREKLIEYKDRTEMLKSLKIAVVNKYSLYIDNIELHAIDKYRYDELPELELANDEEHRYHYRELTPMTVVELMNELEQDVQQFERKTDFSHEADTPYMYYSHSDIWRFIQGLDPYEFLIAMCSILKSNNSQKSILELVEIIKYEFKNFSIEFTNPKAFIAMSFDKSMKSAGINLQNAILESGYTPMLINTKEHNNQIVEEILYEIDQCDFVVADLTMHKNGVYYEAGYALGKGKPVILTCKEDDFQGVHFDVAQKNTILWSDEEDLRKRLKKRIEATISFKNRR